MCLKDIIGKKFFGWKTRRKTIHKFRIRLIWLAERFPFSRALWLAKRLRALTHSPRKWITRNSSAPPFPTIAYYYYIWFIKVASFDISNLESVIFFLIFRSNSWTTNPYSMDGFGFWVCGHHYFDDRNFASASGS